MSTQGTAGQTDAADAADQPSRRTLVIVPTYNERENLPLIVGRARKALPDVHILVVDDGSPDGTGALADELAAVEPHRIHVMHRTVKDGLGAAYLSAFAWGLERGYTVLVEMDADGSHAPEQLYRLLDAIDAGADVAIGWCCPGRPIPMRGCCWGWGSTTSRRATAPTGARCWRNWTSTPSNPRGTASRWT